MEILWNEKQHKTQVKRQSEERIGEERDKTSVHWFAYSRGASWCFLRMLYVYSQPSLLLLLFLFCWMFYIIEFEIRKFDYLFKVWKCFTSVLFSSVFRSFHFNSIPFEILFVCITICFIQLIINLKDSAKYEHTYCLMRDERRETRRISVLINLFSKLNRISL